MEETHFIEVLYDWMGYGTFVVEPREELIICDSSTKSMIFYCTFYERVRMEMHQSIPSSAINEDEFLSIVGTFLIFLFQGL